uniref:Uncharacterized protein n=1 Tax=viral metagenome TaxID=1070528 RepID=A0A6H1ZHC2_9ZZZZ
MIKDKSWKKADYPNRKPAWQKHRIKPAPLAQIQRVFAKLDWEKLSEIGKTEVVK